MMRELANTSHSPEAALSCFLVTSDVAALVCKEARRLINDSLTTAGIPNNVLPTTLIHRTLIWSEKETASLLPDMPPVIHRKSEDGILVSRMLRTIGMIADESVSDKPGVRAIINSLAYAIPIQTSAHTWPPFLLMAAGRCNT